MAGMVRHARCHGRRMTEERKSLEELHAMCGGPTWGIRPADDRPRKPERDPREHLAELLAKGGALAEPFSIGPELQAKLDAYRSTPLPRQERAGT
jgi:hypothetical protein